MILKRKCGNVVSDKYELTQIQWEAGHATTTGQLTNEGFILQDAMTTHAHSFCPQQWQPRGLQKKLLARIAT